MLVERVFNEHSRTVNKLCWRPGCVDILLSGSQDGTVRLWDLRASSCVVTFKPNSEVRTVQFSPHYNNYFAAGLDIGNLQIWDLRKIEHPVIKICAHDGPLLGVDWHPICKTMIASGGCRDRKVKVWNLFGDQRSLAAKPKHEIQTITTVGMVMWRPGYVNQITTTATMLDMGIHIWYVLWKKYLLINQGM